VTTDNILTGLNPQQRQAVTAGEGPVLVLAGPGSGKTRVLTHRIAFLIKTLDVRAFHILAVTFTNKAAREMEARVIRLLEGSGMQDGLALGTFHANCARWLRIEADHTSYTREYAIFDTEDQLRVMKQVIAELNLDPKKTSPRALLNKVSAAKNELIGPEDYQPDDYSQEKVRRAYLRYEELMREYNARDFDDLLVHSVRLFREHPAVLERYQNRYQHVMVDEFQDTNTVQYTLVKLLAGERRNLFAVGDPDQSIYAFRGADFRNVRRFRDDYPDAQVILLEQNYRSHQAILDAAMGVIDQNTDRQRKALFTERKERHLVTVYEAYNEDDEANYVVETIAQLQRSEDFEPGDFAIMYRTNAQSRALEDAFRRYGMPYRVIGATSFYARREIKDVMAYLRLIHNPADNVSFQRIVNVPTRGIGKKTLETLDTWAADLGVTPPEAVMLLLDEQIDAPFSGRARSALAQFATMVEEWRELKAEAAPDTLITRVLNDTGYLAFLDDGTPQGESRIENVLELRSHAESYRGLPLVTFLEEISLVSDVDTRDDDENRPSLMTLHAAKGLEFPVVFIVGLEENILPHSRSVGAEKNPHATPEEKQAALAAIEEERRLMYVGITRAEQRLYLLYATIRSLYGESRANLPSRFLYDIPDGVREGAALSRSARTDREQQSFKRLTTWDRAVSAEDRRTSKPKRKQPTKYKGGDTVWHSKYGEGVVVSSKLSSGMEMVDVLFPGGAGQKTIMADFLKPIE
jgi:DNA helicase II / ATP-dependent DNA helicase PcrA